MISEPASRKTSFTVAVACNLAMPLLMVFPALANDAREPYRGFGDYMIRVLSPQKPPQQSDQQPSAEKAHMMRNADLYNDQLIKLWKSTNIKGGGVITRISFVADHIGNMFDLQVKDSSGNESVDNAALKAVGAMVPMSDFGGQPDDNYLFESIFDGENVTTEYKGARRFTSLRRSSR